MSSLLTILNAFAFSFMLTSTVLNWWSYRQYRKLNMLLLDICVKAWMIRHGPIWQPWADYTQQDLKVIPVKRGHQADQD
jgi:hypothetical protein